MTHPATAEGIYQGMHSGMMAAEALRDVIRNSATEPQAWSDYEARCRRAFGRSFLSAKLWRGAIKSRRYWADDFVAETRFANVGKVVHVQAALGIPDPVDETRWLQAFADRLGVPHGIVAWTTVVNLAKSVSEDIYKRPFITVGFATWCTMLPLAVTSTAGWIRRLGGRRWNRLHRLVYATGVLGVLHYWWLVKADVRRPLTYGFVVAVLLASRVYWSRVRSVSPAAAPRAAKSSVRL